LSVFLENKKKLSEMDPAESRADEQASSPAGSAPLPTDPAPSVSSSAPPVQPNTASAERSDDQSVAKVTDTDLVGKELSGDGVGLDRAPVQARPEVEVVAGDAVLREPVSMDVEQCDAKSDAVVRPASPVAAAEPSEGKTDAYWLAGSRVRIVARRENMQQLPNYVFVCLMLSPAQRTNH
jgi:hypothetical protein